MAIEALEVVRRALAAVNAGDVEAYLALCAPEVELFSPLAGLEGADVGEDGVRHFFANIAETTSAFRIEAEHLEPAGEGRVLALVRYELESPGGFALTQAAANLYEVREGKLLRVRAFLDRDEGLRAAGLAPSSTGQGFQPI